MPSLGPISGAAISSPPSESIVVSGDDLSDAIGCYGSMDEYLRNVLEDLASASLSPGTTELLNVLTTSALLLSDCAAAFGLKVTLTTTVDAADASAAEYLPHLRSLVLAVGSANAKMKFKSALVGNGTFTDTIASAWNMLLADAGDGADTMDSTVRRMAAIADALSASAVANCRLSARVAVAVAAVLEANLSAGWGHTLVDQAAILDQTQNILRAMNTVSDAAAVSDTAAGSLRLSLVCAETVNVDDDLATTLRMNADLADGVLLYCSFRLGDTEYSGWAVNTDLRAATEHRNQPFDSIVSHPKGFHYAAGPGGIVQITGKDDDGAPIDAYLRTFLTDFGTHKFKRVPDIFVGLATDGRMLVKMVTRDPRTGVACDDWYELVTKQDAGEAQGRAKIGRGLKSTWWGMELRNIQGADFRLDEIAWRALILDRRQ